MAALRRYCCMASQTSVKFRPMIIEGRVINRIPHIIAGNEISLPTNVVGTISPYPVVVIVTITNQNADGILSNVLGLLLASTNTFLSSSHSPMIVFQLERGTPLSRVSGHLAIDIAENDVNPAFSTHI